ncbi:MAG TPA: histidine phosphatase family protein [Acidimicrobiales bacterium]|jgi:probable phosphoglycerate mutase
MLVLIRHGESTGNASGLLVGRSDLLLTELGHRQAVAVGRALDAVGEVRSSPLRRALDTARALGVDGPVVPDERWVEMDYGQLEGRPVADVPPEVWGAWRTDPDFRPAGGESLRDVETRVAEACEELFAADGLGRSDSRDVVVVSHVSPIKAAVAWVLRTEVTVSTRLHLSNASLTRIGWGRSGPVLHTYNDLPAAGR